MKHASPPLRSGFTLVEVVVVGAMMFTLFLLATQTLFRGQRSASLTEVASQFVRDARQSQVQAMHGVMPASGAVVDRSIRFEQSRYILFPGTAYLADSEENRTVELGPTMTFSSIGVPDNTVTFARGSGEIRNYSHDARSIVLTDTALGTSYVITFNQYGVVFLSRQ
jgi:type II secretory pathway pseudopilin PulG